MRTTPILASKPLDHPGSTKLFVVAYDRLIFAGLINRYQDPPGIWISLLTQNPAPARSPSGLSRRFRNPGLDVVLIGLAERTQGNGEGFPVFARNGYLCSLATNDPGFYFSARLIGKNSQRFLRRLITFFNLCAATVQEIENLSHQFGVPVKRRSMVSAGDLLVNVFGIRLFHPPGERTDHPNRNGAIVITSYDHHWRRNLLKDVVTPHIGW